MKNISKDKRKCITLIKYCFREECDNYETFEQNSVGMLSATMLTSAVPMLASASADSAAEDAAKRLIASQKYFYNPYSGINLASDNEYPEAFDLRSAKNYVTPVTRSVRHLLGICGNICG